MPFVTNNGYKKPALDYDVSWIDFILCRTVKVTKCKSGPFDYAQSISKWPEGSEYIGNIIFYLTYLSDPIPMGLEVDQKGSSTFLTLIPLMYINRLNLFSHLY